MSTSAAARAAVLLAFGYTRSAAALAPARCRASSPAVRALLAAQGAVTALVATPAGERVALVARVSPRRGRAQLLYAELDASGQWAVAPRVLQTPATSSMAIAADGPARAVVLAGDGRARWITPGAAGEADTVRALAAPARALERVVLASHAGSVSLVWTGVGRTSLQQLVAGSAAPGAPVALRVAPGTTAVSAASGADGTVALAMRTAARRYFIAVADGSTGRLHWPGTAPAGCDRGRCPAVAVSPAPGGFVASWTRPPTRDGLLVPAARPLDARGVPRGAGVTFVPMARAVTAVGNHGEALALQLGRPVVLRGAERPVAVSLARESGAAVAAATWPTDDGLAVLAVDAAGVLSLAHVVCDRPAPMEARP